MSSKTINNELNIRENRLAFLLCLLALVYVTSTNPIAFLIGSSILLTSAVSFGILKVLPGLNFLIAKINKSFQLSFYHVLGGVVSLVTFLGPLTFPSHAIFLSELEAQITGLPFVATSIGAANIATVFTVFRVILILLVIGGGFTAYTNIQQGQNIGPVIWLIAGIFAIVLGVDLVSFIVFNA